MAAKKTTDDLVATFEYARDTKNGQRYNLVGEVPGFTSGAQYFEASKIKSTSLKKAIEGEQKVEIVVRVAKS